ncbi:MAG: hypothetical protein ACODAU_02640 [Myxococcota bacterium]
MRRAGGAFGCVVALGLAAGACASGERPEAETPASPPEARAPEPEPGVVEDDEEELIECEGPPIELAFAWPETLEASVRSLELIEIEDSREEEPAQHAVPTRHRLEVQPRNDDRLAVRFETDGPGRPRLDGLLVEYGEVRPTLVVSEEGGELVAVEGVDAMRAAHDEVRDEQELSDEEASQVLERLDEDKLLPDMRAWWHMALSGWVGRRIGCDEVQTSQAKMPIKTLGAEGVSMELEWRYLGSAPCEEESGRGGQRCAELAVVARADPERTLELLEERVKKTAGQQAGSVDVQRAELVRLVRLRVEPATMILHGVRAEEHIASAFQLQGEPVAGRRQSDAHVLAFRYGTAALQSEDEPGGAGGRESPEVR